jgi:hypothetical protein
MCCNNYMRHVFSGVAFKSPQHRDIVRTWFAAIMETAIYFETPDKDVIIGAVKAMTDPNWWPDERFRF